MVLDGSDVDEMQEIVKNVHFTPPVVEPPKVMKQIYAIAGDDGRKWR